MARSNCLRKEFAPLEGAIIYRYSLRPHTIYLNITNRCSNDCSFCVRNYLPGLSGYRLWLNREPTMKEVWEKIQAEIKESDNEVVFCGFGEPTMRLDMVLELTRMMKKQFPMINIRLNTDGLAQLRNKKRDVLKELKEAGIDLISISLNAENKEKYDLLCRPSLEGSYESVLSFAQDCKKYFFHVRLTVVNLEGVGLSECREIALDLGCDFSVR